jgi:hypothetical protein
VRSSARRRGIGSVHLRRLEEAAGRAGYRLARFDTGARQPAALGLFRSAGYREIDDYTGNELAAHWFEKSLPNHLGRGLRVKPRRGVLGRRHDD